MNVADRPAIHELLGSPGHLMDAGGSDRLGELFTPDVVHDRSAYGAGEPIGSDAIAGPGPADVAATVLAHFGLP